MNENKRNDSMGDTTSSEASARAAKIKAIRNAIRNEEEAPVQPETQQRRPQPPMSSANGGTSTKAKKSGSKGKGKKKKKKKKTLGQTLRGFFPKKGDSVLEVLRKIIFLVSIAAIIVCGYMVGDYYLDLWRSRMQYNEIAGLYGTYEPIYTTLTPEEENDEKYDKYYTLLDGAQKLLDMNPDVIGYMRIPTKDGEPIIELPVVQADDNYKYLDRNFKGEESRAGALFLDSRNHFDEVEDHRLVEKNSDNLVVYGHNMADESMFGKLKYYESNDGYYENHPIIQFNSNYESYTYKIFSFFILDAKDESETKYDCWNQLSFDDEESFYNFVNEAKRRTLRTNDVDVKYGDQILTLSTCHYLLQDRSRLIIMARRLRPGEELYEGTEKSKVNKNIKWPSMYYNTKPNERYDENAIFIPYGPEEAVKEAEEAAAAKKKKESDKKKKEDTAKSKAKKTDTEG
ncbi:MAG: class B sortase [Ruminococcus sp.]|nr:class B sortase [Ruminococcus sp.]